MISKTFQETIKETKKIIEEFKKRERKTWTPEIILAELVKQVGEASKQIMMLEKNYLPQREGCIEYQYSKEKLADEISDILFILIRLAYYEISLEKASPISLTTAFFQSAFFPMFFPIRRFLPLTFMVLTSKTLALKNVSTALLISILLARLCTLKDIWLLPSFCKVPFSVI